ncbi:helix-turn-helix domain-containing protein [Niabella hibiscisoli]|uniref:helix-turn-helix domain-containing protein n=1 Tax=Niabella hibiscisoli TaxID=1825928 RepID=UPI001F0DA555|nr:helix-turn-helix transcriptional regulator [Niabella hibiscisoli]MCH5720764.1 helix-turn-helix transcriptional regulator [Niabella hibiscisoli]
MARRILTHHFSLLHVDKVLLNQKWNYKNVISPYIRIYYIDGGEGLISSIDQNLKLEPGFLYIIPSFTLCNLECSKSLSQFFVHCFEDSPSGLSLFHNYRKPLKIKASELVERSIKQLLKINPNRKIYRSDDPQIYENSKFYREYQELNNQQSEGVFMETQGILLQLISQFISHIHLKREHTANIPSVILDAIRYIQINLPSEISVNQLAKRANLQTDYFSRIFLKHTGKRPLEYVQSKRIERAQYLIMTTNKSFGDIAEIIGFQNLPYFLGSSRSLL